MYVIGEKELNEIRKVFDSGHLFRYKAGGHAPWTGQFEQDLARRVGVKHALAVSSGTGALICALAGLNVGPGDEVIVPGYTFISTALAPPAVGAVPIIAEVDESLTLDPADVEAKITERTKAIIPVHMLGLPCDMDALTRIARKHKVPLLEDAAQASGGSYKGKPFGSIGKVGIFSFNHYKIISSGEGGAVLTDDPLIYRRAMVCHDGGCVFFNKDAAGPKPPFFAGLNFRTSEILSAIMKVQLGRLDGILKRLRARKRAMAEVLAKSDAFALNANNEPDGDCASHLPIIFPSADEAGQFARTHEKAVSLFRPIETDRHVYSNWEPVLNKQAHHPGVNPWTLAGRKYEYSKDMCPQTLDVLSRTVVLATPHDLTVADARKLARSLV